MPELYIALDGDDVGHTLEYYMLLNATADLARFSIKFRNAMDWLIDRLAAEFHAELIFVGGDNVLVRTVPSACSSQDVDNLRSEFQRRAGTSLSAGLGGTARQAYFSLKLAKASGKNRTCCYEEIVDG